MNTWPPNAPIPSSNWKAEPPFLVEEDAPPPPTRQSQGLFQQMLQNDYLPLLSFTSQYAVSSEAHPILQALEEGSRKVSDLHPEEVMLLDALTAEMLTHRPTRPKFKPPVLHQTKEAELDAPPPVTEENLEAYWWLQ